MELRLSKELVGKGRLFAKKVTVPIRLRLGKYPSASTRRKANREE